MNQKGATGMRYLKTGVVMTLALLLALTLRLHGQGTAAGLVGLGAGAGDAQRMGRSQQAAHQARRRPCGAQRAGELA